MANLEFNVGDVVRLKSGGPEMTIEGIGKHGLGAVHDNAKCVWFEGKKRMEGVFELVTLSKVLGPKSHSSQAVFQRRD
jgi:uncharacterized protein YodC (DUF2158 family)